MTLYELWKGKKPNVKYFHIFGSVCYILANREYPRILDAKSDNGIFLGYSPSSRAYRVYNTRTQSVVESINIVVNDNEKVSIKRQDHEDVFLIQNTKLPTVLVVGRDIVSHAIPDIHDRMNNIINSKSTHETIGLQSGPPVHVTKNHSPSCIIGDVQSGVTTKKKDRIDYAKLIVNLCYASSIEPGSVLEALRNELWINAMQEELLQFQRNNVWTLVPKLVDVNIIGTKWIFKNKTDKRGVVTQNKAHLVAQGYTQMEGVEFDKIFTHVARLEAIRLLQKIKLYQMDVKCAFLNGYLNEEVYIAQPKGFIDPTFL